MRWRAQLLGWVGLSRPLPAPAASAKPAGKHIFVSYASADYRDAAALCAHLEKAGFKTWIAPRDVPPGSSHLTIVPEAVAGSSAVVVVLSDATNGARYVQGELQGAVDSDKRVIPIRLNDVMPSADMRYVLARFQWIDAFRMPTDRWRELVIDTLNEQYVPPKRPPQRDVALSPALLTAGAFTFLVAVIVAIVSAGSDAPLLACSSGLEAGCQVTRRSLAGIALLILASAIAVPSFLARHFRKRLAEVRDVITVAVCGTLVLVGALNFLLSFFFAGLVGAVLYFSFLRHWLDERRAAAAGAVLVTAALAGTAVEGEALDAWRHTNPSILSLSGSDREYSKNSQDELTAYHFFVLARRALERMDLPVTPAFAGTSLTPDTFRGLRVTDPVRSLRTRFAAAILEWQPFTLVFTAEAIPVGRCKTQHWALLRFRVEDYELGKPFWALGEPRQPRQPQRGKSDADARSFQYRTFQEVKVTGEPKEDDPLKNGTLVKALVAASIVDWLTAREGAPLLSPRKLSEARDSAMDLLHAAFVDTPWCRSASKDTIPSRDLCERLNAGSSEAIAIAVKQFAARDDKGAEAPFYGPLCLNEGLQQAGYIARVRTGVSQ